MKAAIEIKHLDQGYGKKIVLHDINLKIKTGQILGLLGPSGSGKTTLVRSIMGMLHPQKGTIKVLGQLVPNRRLLRKVGYMAQSDALYEVLSARDNLEFFADWWALKTNGQLFSMPQRWLT